MAEWRDKNNPPKGMCDYVRWYRPPGIDSRMMPSDGDAILHSKNGNRFILFEFKPKSGALTVGQRILLEGFSEKPGCMSVAIYDPYSHDSSRAQYADSLELEMTVFLDGCEQDMYLTTVENLNRFISWWFTSGAQ